MKSYFDEKLTTRWFRGLSQKQHAFRIEKIKQSNSHRIDNSPPRPHNNTTFKPISSQRSSEIYQKNLHLLHKLTEIRCGRLLSSTHDILKSVKLVPKLKSLNLQNRVKEDQRIQEDNQKSVKKLIKSTDNLSIKKLNQEWLNTAKYKRTISKAKFRKNSEKKSVDKAKTRRGLNYIETPRGGDEFKIAKVSNEKEIINIQEKSSPSDIKISVKKNVFNLALREKPKVFNKNAKRSQDFM